MTHHKTLSLHPFIIFVSALAWYVIFYVDLIALFSPGFSTYKILLSACGCRVNRFLAASFV
jgi:hypothetical protein